jgi:tripartite ATP-independent transporter DctP family solute receptor
MRIRISRRHAIGGLAAALAAPHVARAATRVIRFGHNNTDESHYARGTAAFAAAVAADPALSAAVRVEVHGNAELGDEVSMLKACAASTLDGMLCSNSVMGNLIADLGLLNAPFLFRDVALARAMLDGEIGAEFAKRAAAKDVHVMAWSENGLRHITSNQPIRTPADLHGLKIRVPQSAVMLGGFKALGADAAPLNFSLLREALRTGQFQAQENPIVVIEAAKLYELQKFLSLTGHVYDAAAFICSADLLDDLTEAQRTALTDCARKGAAVTREVSATAQKDGIARLTAKGMTVVDNVDVAAFRTAARPFLESLSASFDTSLVKRLLDAAA